MQRSELRALLEQLLPGTNDVDAFCVDYFIDVSRQLAPGMEYTQRLNILLTREDPETVLLRLKEKIDKRVPADRTIAQEPVAATAVDSAGVRFVVIAGTGLKPFAPILSRASEALGAALATAGYGLITSNWEGVDSWVALAFARAFVGKWRPSERQLSRALKQVIAADEQPRYRSGAVHFLPADCVGIDEIVERTKAAEAVILIGGRGGTRQTGEIGLKLGLPVFPLPHTSVGANRDAVEMYDLILREYASSPMAKTIPFEDFQSLSDPFPHCIESLIRLLDLHFNASRT